MKYSAWEDAIYTVTGMTSFIFNIYDDNSTLVYTGKAYQRPNVGNIEINVSEIVRNYLDSRFPNSAFNLGTFNTGEVFLPNAVLGFSLTDEKGTTLETYMFLNCWDYVNRFSLMDNVGMALNINQPVNDHTATGQFTFTSTLTKTNKVKVNIQSLVSGATSCGYGALYYSNSLGGWDHFLIEGRMKKKDTYTKYDIDNNFRVGTLQFGHRTLNNTISESWELQTHYLTDEESKRLVNNLFGSNNVYFHDFVGNKIYPVVITDTSVEVKNWKNQGKKHFIHTINIKSSQDKMRM